MDDVIKYKIIGKMLIFSWKFNEKLDKYLITIKKNRIRELKFCLESGNNYSLFNQYIKCLPKSIVKIEFGCCFNNHVLVPAKLTHLSLGFHYNLPILLPSKLLYLSIDSNYKHKIILPESLVYLKINSNNQFIIGNLTNSIKTYVFGYEFTSELDNLSNSVQKVDIQNFKYPHIFNCQMYKLNHDSRYSTLKYIKHIV